jgi:hypothetical protein
MWESDRLPTASLAVLAGVLGLARPVAAAHMHFGTPAALVLGHDPSPPEREKLAELGATVILGLVAGLAGLAAAALTVCCMYDTASYWYHKVHFHSCLRKVQRVHEVFSGRRGELPLCPYCVENITEQASPQKVVFLCGHRFHMDCANRWFLENPGKTAGRCPICSEGPLAFPFEQGSFDKPAKSSMDLARPLRAKAAPAPWAAAAEAQNSCRPCQEADLADGASAPAGDSVSDEAQVFILGSLHRQYSDIISKACVKRWSYCNTELWLSELSCPRWQRHYPCCSK